MRKTLRKSWVRMLALCALVAAMSLVMVLPAYGSTMRFVVPEEVATLTLEIPIKVEINRPYAGIQFEIAITGSNLVFDRFNLDGEVTGASMYPRVDRQGSHQFGFLITTTGQLFEYQGETHVGTIIMTYSGNEPQIATLTMKVAQYDEYGMSEWIDFSLDASTPEESVYEVVIDIFQIFINRDGFDFVDLEQDDTPLGPVDGLDTAPVDVLPGDGLDVIVDEDPTPLGDPDAPDATQSEDDLDDEGLKINPPTGDIGGSSYPIGFASLPLALLLIGLAVRYTVRKKSAA